MFTINKNSILIKKTKHKGLGVFAKITIEKGTIIGDYTGKLVDYLDVDYEAEKKQMYLMYYNDKRGIYPHLSKPGVHLINHSCSPNCWLGKYQDRILVFALRDIMPSEEITINYLLPPRSNCKKCPHRCFCQSPNCQGTMHLTEKGYKKWRSFQKENWKTKTPTNIKNYLKPLKKYPKDVNIDYLTKVIETGLLSNFS